MALTCPACGTEIAPGKFCPECGAQLSGGAEAPREVRKLVTVLFADVTGSTALGERLDPEAVRALMTRYFTAMRRVIERHGGTVEKFIGDAVMAVFGIPVVHEDDALRAVRAAAEIRDVIEDLNRQLEAERRTAVQFRTGLYTGEVVAGEAGSETTLVTGNTVNTAARLEQAARPGEILLGQLTYSFVRDAVEVERVEPIAAKGKAEPVEAFRLIAVRAGSPGRARHLDTPMVGREEDLGALRDAWRGVVDARIPHRLTVVAAAGVGKSRLVREFIAAIRGEGGRALVGRCLSYGDGITYWPVRELVHAAAGISEGDDRTGARGRVEALLRGARDDTVLAARIASAVGLSSEPAPQEELFWAVRRLFEHLAAERPTLVVIEDVHWADDTLLDLLESIVDLGTGVPLLVLATARPELAEHRLQFLEPRAAASVVRLEPLAGDAAGALLDALPGGTAVPPSLRARILDAADGNPLYVEELLGFLRDEGTVRETAAGWEAGPELDAVSVPATIQALLAARLEALPATERGTARRASVMGRSFELAALADIDRPHVGDLTTHVAALVRKELLRPDRPDLTAGEAFRFRHALIRDAAYEALPKAERAVLHERFADWLEHVAGDRRPEVEAILGHHLEQAYGYLVELGETGERVDGLAGRASRSYEAAGMQADLRGDSGSVITLLARATAMKGPPTAEDDLVLLTLAESLNVVGREQEARDLLEGVLERARARRDLVIEARAAILELLARGGLGDPPLRSPEYEELEQQVRALAERSGDDLALARAWNNASAIAWDHSQWDESYEAIERSLHHAERAGSRRMVQYGWIQLATAAVSGPQPLGEGLTLIDGMLAQPALDLEVQGELLERRALILAMFGRLDEARADVEAARRTLLSIGQSEAAALCQWQASWVERLGGDYARELELIDIAAGQLPSIERMLAAGRGLALAKLGAFADATAALDASEGDTWERTVRTRALGRARVAVASGHNDEAFREAADVEATAREDPRWLNGLAESLVETAVIAALAGDHANARRRATDAMEASQQKENVALAGKARAVLAGDLSRL